MPTSDRSGRAYRALGIALFLFSGLVMLTLLPRIYLRHGGRQPPEEYRFRMDRLDADEPAAHDELALPSADPAVAEAQSRQARSDDEAARPAERSPALPLP